MQWLRDLLADNIDVFVAAMLGIVGIVSTHAMAVVSRRHERNLEQDRAAHATVERQRTERRDLYLRLLEAVESLPHILLYVSMDKEGIKPPMDPQDLLGLQQRAEERLNELARLRPRVRFEATSSVVRAFYDVVELTASLVRSEYERGLVDEAVEAIDQLQGAIRRDQGLL